MACNYSFGLVKYMAFGLLLHCTIPCNAAASFGSSSALAAAIAAQNKKDAASASPSPAGSAGLEPSSVDSPVQKCVHAISDNNPDELKGLLENISEEEIDFLMDAHRALATKISQQSLHPSDQRHTKALQILSLILKRQKQLEPQQQRQQ